MDITSAGFDARHSEHMNNTEVLLALLTQNKELEGMNFLKIMLKKHTELTSKHDCLAWNYVVPYLTCSHIQEDLMNLCHGL